VCVCVCVCVCGVCVCVSVSVSVCKRDVCTPPWSVSFDTHSSAKKFLKNVFAICLQMLCGGNGRGLRAPSFMCCSAQRYRKCKGQPLAVKMEQLLTPALRVPTQ